MIAVRRKLTAAAEIVHFACYKVICQTVTCIKMRRKGYAVCIYRNKHSLALIVTLYNALSVCKYGYFQIAVAECFALSVSFSKLCDKLCKLVCQSMGEAWDRRFSSLPLFPIHFRSIYMVFRAYRKAQYIQAVNDARL